MDVKMIEELYGRELVCYECTADDAMCFRGDVDGLSTILGYCSSRSWDGVSLWELLAADELDRRRRMLLEQLAEGDLEVALPLVCADGSVSWFLNRGHVCGEAVKGILVSIGRIKGLFDHQEGKLNRYKERLERTETIVSTLQVLSEQDSLTKLYNADTTRRMCTEYLSFGDSQCALIMFDLDGFKQVNDVLGHMEGDRVITRVASEIKGLFRSGDVVGRVGGDEFLVLMKDIPDADIVIKKCATLVSAVTSVGEQLGCPFLGCSAGAVVTFAGGADYDELFRCADAAMYSVKNAGGRHYNVVSCYTDR